MSRETPIANFAYATSDRPLLETIAAALEGLRYGALEIIVHDGRVVQIERKEKLRLEGNRDLGMFQNVKK
ncbi:MAG: YezD family protein [Methylococcales bacterium]